MASPFVPFLPPASVPAAEGSARLKVRSTTSSTSLPSSPSFTPLTPLPKAPASPHLHAPLHPAPLPHLPASAQSPPAPRAPILTFHRQGDVITGIRIECSCGEIIELACQYQTG